MEKLVRVYKNKGYFLTFSNFIMVKDSKMAFMKNLQFSKGFIETFSL